jgi:hypothetical protein
VSLSNWIGGAAFLGPIAGLGVIALVLVLGRFAFWLRHFARRTPARGAVEGGVRPGPSGDPIADILLARRNSFDRAWRLATELLTSSGRRIVLLDGAASLAALLGLAGTFIALRGMAVGVGSAPVPFEAGRLAWALGPLLSGLAVFVFARASLGLFHAWENSLRLEVGFALQTPLALPAVRIESPVADLLRPAGEPGPQAQEPPPRPAAASETLRGWVRRPWAPPPREGVLASLRAGALFAVCLLGSVLFHSAIILLARHLDSSASSTRAREGDGVFHASLVANRPEPEALRLESKREEALLPPEPPAVPPPPPAVPKEPEPARPPKSDPEVLETPAAESKPAPEKEEARPASRPEPSPSPPPPAAIPEAERIPEPAAPAEPKTKETADARPDPPAQPRYTETPKAPEKSPEPVASPPAPEGRSLATPAAKDTPVSSPEPAANLGLGQKAPENSEPTALSPSPRASNEISTLGDYRRFLSREMKTGASEGQYVPNLRFGDNKPQENREIMRYFGMELIAYPADQKFYVYIEPEQGLFSRSNDFSYIRNFSTRVIFRNSPYFDTLRAETARRIGVDASSLVVAQLLKPSSAAYIGWKERESAKRAGIVLEDVEACEATFVKTPFGVWIVRIDRLLLRDGKSVPVRDFEWARLSNGKGDDP